jgi:carboxymethylenebutenolidase
MHSKHVYTPIHRYCFGGSTCVRLGGTDLVNSVIIVHPGTFTLDQVNAIKVPASWICAEGENM